MIFWIAKTICGLTGWDVSKVQKRLLAGVMILAAIVFIVIVSMIYKACHHGPKLDEKQIQKVQDAIASGDRAEREKVFEEVKVAEKQIDANTVDASTKTVNAIADAKKQAAGMTNEQLADELERKLHE